MVIPEPYGDSVNTGVQFAVFKKEPTVCFYDGNIWGVPYPEKYYRVEKKHEEKTVRLFVSYYHIINADDGIADRIIKTVNTPSLSPAILNSITAYTINFSSQPLYRYYGCWHHIYLIHISHTNRLTHFSFHKRSYLHRVNTRMPSHSLHFLPASFHVYGN